jgi:hypothetical protein
VGVVSEELRTDAVSVLDTTVDATIGAARIASELATAMRVPLRVVHFRSAAAAAGGRRGPNAGGMRSRPRGTS